MFPALASHFSLPMLEAPALVVIPGRCVLAGPGTWHASWTLASTLPWQLLESWLPHDHFSGPRDRYDPPLAFDPEGELRRVVACEDPSGSVIENAFLILHIKTAGETYRVFARLTVTIDQEGTPDQTCEAVTVQQVETT